MIISGWSYPVNKIKVFTNEETEVSTTYITTEDTNKIGDKVKKCFCSIMVEGVYDVHVGDRVKIGDIKHVKITQTYNPQTKRYYTMCQICVKSIEVTEEVDEKQMAYESVEEILENSKDIDDLLPF